jgi:hypothetical protein
MADKLLVAKNFLKKISKDGKGFVRVIYNDWIDDYNKDTNAPEISTYASTCEYLDKVLAEYKPKKVKDYGFVNKSPGFDLRTLKDEIKNAPKDKDGNRIVKKISGNLIFDKNGNLISYENTKEHEYTVWMIENIELEKAFKIIDDTSKYEDGLGYHPSFMVGVDKTAFMIGDSGNISAGLDTSNLSELDKQKKHEEFEEALKKDGFYDEDKIIVPYTKPKMQDMVGMALFISFLASGFAFILTHNNYLGLLSFILMIILIIFSKLRK